MAKKVADTGLLRVPPQSLDVEQAVLGALFLDNEAVAMAAERIDATFFYKSSHRHVFNAILDLFQKDTEVDLLTITDILKKKGVLEDVGGPSYIAEISNSIPSSANIEQHLDIIKEKALSRMLIKECDTIISKAYEESEEIDTLLDFAESKIFEISERRLKKGFASIDPILHRTFERIDELYHSSRSGVTGVATGYKKLDEMTAGLQRSDLVILAGRPSMGKTAFALNLARNAAIDFGMAVGFFSLEMSADALVMRLLCTEAKVNQMAVRTGKLTKDEMNRLTEHVGKLMSAPIYIDDSPSLNVLELRAKARRLKAERNVELLIVDYLQLMDGTKGENRQQEITHISRSVKAIAKELDVPVLALSQLSRQVEQRGVVPNPSHLLVINMGVEEVKRGPISPDIGRHFSSGGQTHGC